MTRDIPFNIKYPMTSDNTYIILLLIMTSDNTLNKKTLLPVNKTANQSSNFRITKTNIYYISPNNDK